MPFCSMCKIEKSLNDFSKGLRSDGTSSICRECYREYQKKWRANNREKELKRYKAYREANRELIREKSRERMRKKRLNDPEGQLRYTREYRAANPEKAALWDNRKKSIRRGSIGDCKISSKQWKEIKEKYQNSCAYCLKPSQRLTIDHIIPLSKGGTHTIDNIAPACKPCNFSKQAKNAVDWVQEKHGRLL